MAFPRNTTSSTARNRLQQIEEQMIKRREKEFMHQQTWNGLTRYYETFNNKNTKYEEWTSPRYYQTHQTMLEQQKKENQRKELLEKRREKLRKLFHEEEQSYSIELAVKTRDKWRLDTELLKNVSVNLKLQEEEKRQKEAELALYNQWRRNNPTLREYERCLRSKELKLSWLDQQIEKRMQKEREQEEFRKLLQERDKNLMELQKEEELFRKQLEEKRERLRNDLQKQMEDLAKKEAASKQLKNEEQERLNKQLKLEQFYEAMKREEERIKSRELALFNIKHHKLKLKQKAQIIQENLIEEENLLKQLRETEFANLIEDKNKRKEWKETLEQFLLLVNEQRNLEKNRQAYLDSIFESEANNLLKKQNEIWHKEKLARDELFKDVLDTIKKQIDLKMTENRKEQLELLMEREKNLKDFEEYNRELQKIDEEELRKKQETKRSLDEQIKERNELKRRLKNLEQKNLDLELEKARREEERLKMEIMKLQQKQTKLSIR